MMQFIGVMSQGGATIPQVALNWLMAKGVQMHSACIPQFHEPPKCRQLGACPTVDRTAAAPFNVSWPASLRAYHRPRTPSQPQPECIMLAAHIGCEAVEGIGLWQGVLSLVCWPGWHRTMFMRRRRHPHSGRPQRGAGEGAGGGAGLVARRQRGGHDRREGRRPEVVVKFARVSWSLDDNEVAMADGMVASLKWCAGDLTVSWLLDDNEVATIDKRVAAPKYPLAA
jgi:hypothetical protein